MAYGIYQWGRKTPEPVLSSPPVLSGATGPTVSNITVGDHGYLGSVSLSIQQMGEMKMYYSTWSYLLQITNTNTVKPQAYAHIFHAVTTYTWSWSEYIYLKSFALKSISI